MIIHIGDIQKLPFGFSVKKKVCNYKNPLIGIYEQYCSRCKAMVPGVGCGTRQLWIRAR